MSQSVSLIARFCCTFHCFVHAQAQSNITQSLNKKADSMKSIWCLAWLIQRFSFRHTFPPDDAQNSGFLCMWGKRHGLQTVYIHLSLSLHHFLFISVKFPLPSKLSNSSKCWFPPTELCSPSWAVTVIYYGVKDSGNRATAVGYITPHLIYSFSVYTLSQRFNTFTNVQNVLHWLTTAPTSTKSLWRWAFFECPLFSNVKQTLLIESWRKEEKNTQFN